MIGKTISGFKIIRKLGEGGMGEVFLAEEMQLHRSAALKFLVGKYLDSADAQERFIREARSAAALNHPNIVTIYRFGEFEEGYFIAMEYVKGESLDQVIARKVLPFEQIIDYTLQICEGLGEAHLAGIVHRDIKPKNILLDQKKRIKILDFGIAKLSAAPDLTSQGETLGTLHYLSPEHVGRGKVDKRSDLFSLGIVLYELITSQRPFVGDNQAAVLFSIINETPQPLERYRANVPPGLQHIIDKALAKNNQERYQAVDDFIADLKRERKALKLSRRRVKQEDSGPQLSHVPRKLATIIGIDLESGGTEAASPDETLQLPRAHHDKIVGIVDDHDGHLIKRIGNSSFFEVANSAVAVDCCWRIVQALAELTVEDSASPAISTRISLHVGEVADGVAQVDDEGLMIATELLAMCTPGSILMTEPVFSAIRTRSSRPILARGTHRGNSSAHGIRLYEIQDIADKTEANDTANAVTKTGPAEATASEANSARQWHLVGGLTVAVLAALAFWMNTENSTSASPPAVAVQQEQNKSGAPLPVRERPDLDAGMSRLIAEVEAIEDPQKLQSYLQNGKQSGRLAFGTRSQFPDPDNYLVVIFDRQKIYSLLLYQNELFYELSESGKSYKSLSGVFKGKIDVWVKPFE